MTKLAPLQEAVLAAVARQKGEGYGISIMDEVSEHEGREVAYGSIHVALDKLHKEGWVSAKMGDPTPERGGRRKRFYEITGKGRQALNAAHDYHSQRATGLGWLKPAGA